MFINTDALDITEKLLLAGQRIQNSKLIIFLI